MQKQTKNYCAICGVVEATTSDHIPPKNIFLKPRPPLITVPACQKCNNGASPDDDKFKVYLSMHSYMRNPKAETLFWEKTVPAIAHNRKFRQDLLATIVPVNLVSGNVWVGKAFKGQWDSGVHERIIERTIRGLYFHHFNEILGNRVRVKTQFLKRIDNGLIAKLPPITVMRIGTEEFVYGYFRSSKNPLNSIWLFQFYKSHWASGYTVPPDEDIRL